LGSENSGNVESAMLNVEWLEERVAAAMAADAVPGVALAVFHHGAVVYARGFGVTSVEEGGVPITPRTLFQIGSTTKPLTGTMLMRLVERGALDLDRPVRTWLPDLRFSVPGAAERVTLRMLLSHTAGLPWDQITPTRLHGSRDPSALAAWVRDELPHRPLVAMPGEQWSYSNPGINLAAHLAEIVTGETYPDLMRSLVFAPLGMTRTTFDPTVAMTYPHAQAHEWAEDGTLRVVHRAPDNAAQYPSAFAYSTALDLANFALLHLREGRFGDTQILSSEGIAAMHAPQSVRGDTSGGAYGLTFFIDSYRGMRQISLYGGISSFSSEFTLLPEANVGVILLRNHGDDFDAPAIVRAIFDDLLETEQGS
jgi:CubicO group peptidase (beta-lactamase class C family)